MQTDKRASFISAKLNLMIASALDYLFLSTNDLMSFLKKESVKSIF
ncbi:MAG: hypothetical protein ACFFG0_06740 [Candidatus Thorarchaeota archaeon]